MNLLLERLTQLKNKGFDPPVIYDLGAFVGGWSSEIKELFPNAQIYAFEANDVHRVSLANVVGEKNVAIGIFGAQNKPVTFYSRNDTGDSCLQENTSYFIDNPNTQVSTRQMFRVDDVVKEKGFSLPDFVKLDLQGAELEALKGGLSTLTNAEIIILEVKILEYNLGAPTFIQTIQFMDSVGYVPLDITELHYLHTGELNECDVLFCKRDSKYYKRGVLQ